MILQILKGTPPFVFGIFFYLLFVGYQRTKAQTLSKPRILMLPALLIVLSFYGIIKVFGFNVISLACWVAAVISAIGLSHLFKFHGEIKYSHDTRLFEVPGSCLPMILMSAIFITKYFVTVLIFKSPELIPQLWFVVSVSAAYGLFSGLFLSRAVLAFAAMNPTAVSHNETNLKSIS